MRKWLERFRDAFNWGWLAYRIIGVLVATGIASAVGGAVWAVLIGVPLPIAIMAGYCTLVGAAYLAMVPLAYRALAPAPAPAPAPAQPDQVPKKSVPPNLTAWRMVPSYTLSEAAHLWCDLPPTGFDTHDTLAWFKVLRARVQERKLKVLTDWPNDRRMQAHEITEPSDSTRVTRGSLQEFAKENKFDPAFLRDKD